MPTTGHHSSHSFARRKPPHRIIIAHGENVRSFTIRPWLIAIVGGVALTFGTLYLSATGYLVFRDDLLAASIARHRSAAISASLRSCSSNRTSRHFMMHPTALQAAQCSPGHWKHPSPCTWPLLAYCRLGTGAGACAGRCWPHRRNGRAHMPACARCKPAERGQAWCFPAG